VCYAQHYVFNLVYLDILDILCYISETYSNNLNNSENLHLNLNEIKTSINTITYVINHMFEELSQLKLTSPDQYKEYENRSYKLKVIGLNRNLNKSFNKNFNKSFNRSFNKIKSRTRKSDKSKSNVTLRLSMKKKHCNSSMTNEFSS